MASVFLIAFFGISLIIRTFAFQYTFTLTNTSDPDTNSGKRCCFFVPKPKKEKSENIAITKLREYVRINTSHPNPDYESGIKWFRKEANFFGLKFNLVRFTSPDLFAVWLTWKGTNPNLKSILLNSHMDVVDVNRDKWTHDPFSAYKDSDGNIYGRGIADMKSKTIVMLEAIRQLKQEGFRPLRTIHVSVIPDEEIGGEHGMKAFINSNAFKQLNVALDLDEGGSGRELKNGTLSFGMTNGEKSAWQFNVTAEGVTGHGSSTIATGTAGQKIQKVIHILMEKRKSEIAKLSKPNVTSSDITSINLVQLGGGMSNNVLPDLLWAFFDMRIRAHPDQGWNFTDVEDFLDNMCARSGPGVSYTFFQKGISICDTPADHTNIWWTELKKIFDKMNWKLHVGILTGETDGRYVRNAGIPAFGFGLGINKFGANLGGIHGNNEAINEKDFLESIPRYKIVFKGISMVPGSVHP